MNVEPKVTVLMPVYNEEKYLPESIESILSQTFKNFDFLIIDDGSTDNSEKIIRSYNDSRIQILLNGKNIGIVKTLNKGLKLSKGKYIVRMDADDVSLPERLEKQITYMEENPETGVLGCNIRNVDKNLNFISENLRPITHYQNLWKLLYKTNMMHPTVVFRKSVLSKNGYNYNSKFKRCEDYELWSRLAYVTVIEQIPDILVMRRHHEGAITKWDSLKVSQVTYSISGININRLFSNKMDSNRIDNLVSYLNGSYNDSERWWSNVCYDLFEMYILFCSKNIITRDDINWIAKDWLKLLVNIPLKYRMMALLKCFNLKTVFGYRYFIPVILMLKIVAFELKNILKK